MINNCITFTSKKSASVFRSLFLIFSLFVLITCSISLYNEAHCAQVSMGWDAVTGSGLAGYKVHYGTASKNYSSVADAGMQTTYTMTGLAAGTTYYFAATSYNSAGTESSYSNEVAYTVPASCSYAISPATASYTGTGGTGSISVNTSAGCSWTTSNSNSWVTITSGTSGTGPGTVQYSVSSNTGSSTRTASLTIAGAGFSITQTGGSSSTYTISASAGSGGSISPSGGVGVSAGGSQSFTISPSSGYRVSAVTVDGASVGAVTSYTFTNVTANHTISAAFAVTNTSYTLTMTKAGTGGGTVTNSPSGSSFAAGTVVTLTAAPDANSTFAGWSGGCSGNTTTTTVTMNTNVTATATFNPKAGNDIWPNTTAPVSADSGPDGAVELGVKFRSDTAGNISGIRFYKASTNTGTHVGNLWTSTGTLLATATFTNETASGWQQVNFATPVAIAANTVYVASYHANSGHYSCDQNYFASTGVDAPPLHLLATGVSGNNGVYAYGSSSVFPSQGWNSSNYWVDVVYSANPAPPPPPPQTNYTLWQSSAVPVLADAGADNAVELGVNFRSDSNGYISGIRFYKASTNTGAHVANLWSSTGALLATATFTNETASGWQQVNFSSRVPITANTVYVASYHANTGHYALDRSYFSTTGVDAPPLHAPVNGATTHNGVYAYGSTSNFPSQGGGTNYWVDPVFQLQ